MANIGDLFFTLGLDDAKLIPDAKKQGQAAGEAAGQAASKSLGSKLGTGLKTSFMGMGVAASGAFALATKGALEMENVQVDLQRETGLTADEAKRAASEINGIAGRNVQDIGAVSAAFAKVHNDLGLTGDAAAKATEAFVKFGRATGQDAASAVSSFDDILDGFGLTADDAAGIMDKLVVAHQKFGGSIADNQSALAAMAPQLKALNLGLDDGIGLLDLFAASGLDASSGQKALNAAIKKLPPGETLDQFLVRLSKVQDDGQRAQLAMSVFGTKAGAGLANAIKPGVGSLKDFEISAQDAAGATDKAADVIDSSFSGRIAKAVSIARGQLRQFGADFGPALTGVASLGTLVGSVFPSIGSKIVRGLAGAIKGLGVKFAQMLGVELGSKVVATAASESVAGAVTAATAESSAAGVAASAGGKVLGRLVGLGLQLGLVLAVAEAADLLHDPINKLGQSIHDQLFGSGTGFLGTGFSLDDVPWPLGNKGAPDWAKGAKAAEAGAKSVVDGAAKGAATGGKATGGSWADALPGEIKGKAPAVAGAGTTLGKAGGNAFKNAMKGAIKSAGPELQTTASAAISSVATGILDKQDEVDAALSAALDFQKRAKNRPQQAAHLIGLLTGEELIKGLHDKNPDVRRAFDVVRQDALDRLKTLGINMNHLGKAGGEELAKALRSKDPDVRHAAERLRATLEGNVTPTTKPAGAKGGTDLAAGLTSTEGANKGAAQFLMLTIQQNTKPNTNANGVQGGNDLASGLRSTEGANKGAAQGLATVVEQNATPNTAASGVAGGRDLAAGLNGRAARQAIVSAVGSLIGFIDNLLTISPQVTVRASVTRLPPRNTGGSHAGSSPRQHGGPVSPLGSYVVGERGPELFVPRVSGHIVPHNVSAAHESPAAANVVYNVNMTAARPTTVVDAMRELRRYGEMGLLPATGRRR